MLLPGWINIIYVVGVNERYTKSLKGVLVLTVPTRDDSKKEKLKINKQENHNPTLAMLLSILFAGLGQLYNRRFLKGAIFLLVEFAFLFTFLDLINFGLWGLRTLGTIPGTDHSIRLLVFGVLALIGLFIAIALYVYNVIDARKQAYKKIGRAHV